MSTRDLHSGRIEALQGLLSSLGHGNDEPSPAATLSTVQLQKLSEKINEILGDGKDQGLMPDEQPNQLLNEDGLPIVDISEPVDEDLHMSTPSPLIQEQDLVPLSLLSHAERERRRQERDRILDMLQEEEHLQQLQEEQDAEQERKDAIRKRKESAKAELNQLRVARELQRKMGQALIGHTGIRESGQGGARLKPQAAPTIPTKSVTFADAPAVEADKKDPQTPTHQSGRADVSLGRLRTQSHIPLVSTAGAQKYPMKMHVVERHSVAASTISPSNDADSDDESTSAVQLSPRLENDSSGEDESLTNKNTLSDGTLLAEGFDDDMVQHCREIALEYHKKRHIIGAETARVMAADISNDYDQQEIPKGRLPLSRFRAGRMAAVYDNSQVPTSISPGKDVIPASRQMSLRDSVRLGKLENDQLMGGESGESGNEDETTREVIQMLRTGNIQNVGPDFEPSSISTITHPKNPGTMESQSTERTAVPHGAKPSKFVANERRIAETTTFKDIIRKDNVHAPSIISNVVERKAPRSSPGQHFPVNKRDLRPQVKNSKLPVSMVIDSPSFAMAPTSAPSPAHPTTTASSLYHQTQPEHSPIADADSSTMQNLVIPSQVPTRDPSSTERPVSKFMAKRRTVTE